MNKEISKGCIKEGDKFNSLTAIKFSHEEIKKVNSSRQKQGFTQARIKVWEFKCDCGNIVFTDDRTVKYNKRKSCGCVKTKMTIERNIKNSKPYGEASRKNLLNKYLYSAKKRELDFNLSEEQFTWLVKQDCHYCKVEPIGLIKAEGKNGEYKYNGIDRIDSNIGYDFDNCVPCCKFCNMAKREYPLEEFLAWIKRLRDGSRDI